MEINKNTYSDKKTISYYEKYEGLQKPEQTIFNLFKDNLAELKMLDIGIGAGRTTVYFGSCVKEYTGIDYAEGMIEVCKKKFKKKLPNALFLHCDVRDLQNFSENHFDFILFSFNGIDYISAEERIIALRQIRRVLKPGGYFCFSSHNIQSLEKPFKFEFRLNLLALFKNWMIWRKVKNINRSELEKVKSNDFVLINDGAHNFTLQTCYFRPLSQEKILATSGFDNNRFFSLENGDEIKSEEISSCTDRWVYYMCNASKI